MSIDYLRGVSIDYPDAPFKRVTLTVWGIAQPKGSTRAFQRGKRIIVTSDNPKLKGWEAQVKHAAALYVRANPVFQLFTGPVSLELKFLLPRPPSVSAKARPWPSVRPDLSKLIRGAEDALNGVIWQDDALVVQIAAGKFYTTMPARAELLITDAPTL